MTPMEKLRFRKEEKLKSRKAIADVFDRGTQLFQYPFKMYFDVLPEETASCIPQMSVSVPKKKFKKAVDRNKLKRRIREAYRLNNKALKTLCIEKALPLSIMWVYIAREIEPYEKIESSLRKLLHKVNEHYTHGGQDIKKGS
ncbi:MAG: ribonuclease P protein component [Saprospiraceae bacterium]|nr:ribonuclease P protein component [Saprospiraceae bacterium]